MTGQSNYGHGASGELTSMKQGHVGYNLQGGKVKQTPGMTKNFKEPRLDNTGYRDSS